MFNKAKNAPPETKAATPPPPDTRSSAMPSTATSSARPSLSVIGGTHKWRGILIAMKI
ncbi:hypothetical protein HORIV_47870 [Vreelandella olivaria]|uniref:Uncharacterized protein n=1 Tax=Vreelandella olivaria TaxID=390919 RepID=A0ABM7GKN0_9GAMM|nr:hypothetical protein HORIV_47870 [Halomonas olivaria]